jgi:hypothetical protein
MAVFQSHSSFLHGQGHGYIWASLIFRTGINWNKKHTTKSDNLNVFIENFGVVMLTIVSFTKNKNFENHLINMQLRWYQTFFLRLSYFEDRGNDEFIAGYGFSLSPKISSGYIVKLKKFLYSSYVMCCRQYFRLRSILFTNNSIQMK